MASIFWPSSQVVAVCDGRVKGRNTNHEWQCDGVTHLPSFEKLYIIVLWLLAVPVMADMIQSKLMRFTHGILGVEACVHFSRATRG